VLGPNEDFPSLKTRQKVKEERGASVLYLKKSHGQVMACTTKEADFKVLNLPKDKIDALEQLISLEKASVVKNSQDKKNRRKIFDIQKICGYPNYIYRVSQVNTAPEKSGSQGKIYFSSGKLEFYDGVTKYSKVVPQITKSVELERYTDEKQREYVTYNAMTELSLLTQTPALRKRLHTKAGTVQKTKEGKIESVHLTQRNVGKMDLFDYLREPKLKDRSYRDYRSKLFRLLVEAMANDHAAGIVHRDIKLENIIVEEDENGDIKKVHLVDYGLARKKGSMSENYHVGTSLYFSPEYLMLKQVDSQNDDYALGLLLRYVLLENIGTYSHMLIFGKDEQEENLRRYLKVQFYLNLTMLKADIPSSSTNSLSPNQIRQIEYVLTGLTKSAGERLSSEDAWKMLSTGIVPEVKEIAASAKVVSDDHYRLALIQLFAIQDETVRKILLKQALDQLEKYCAVLKIKINEKKPSNRLHSSYNFLIDTYERLKPYEDYEFGVGQSGTPVCVAVIAKILIEEKKFLADQSPISETDQKNFRNKQMWLLDEFYDTEHDPEEIPLWTEFNREYLEKPYPPSPQVFVSETGIFGASPSSPPEEPVKIHIADPDPDGTPTTQPPGRSSSGSKK